MRLFNRDEKDKIDSLNRCFFDAEHGWISLSLARLDDLNEEFQNDPYVLYAEGLIRKDFLGQGLKAEELFIAAQKFDNNPNIANDNLRLATFNAAKYARNESEFRHQASIALRLFPDDPEFKLFYQQISQALLKGISYADIMAINITMCQQHAKHGDCAAFAEIALQAGEHNIDKELGFRRVRFDALRQLDKAAEASRKIRGEAFPPNERLPLKEAMAEINKALSLDPEYHIDWNFKSAWHILLHEFSQAEAAADKAIELCPDGYYKPRLCKAIALAGLDKKAEAMQIATAIFESLKQVTNPTLDDKQDRELAESTIRDLSASSVSDDVALKALAEQIVNSAQLTRKKELERWNLKASKDGAVLQKGLEQRVMIVGNKWSASYIKIMAELLVFFTSEIALIAVIRLDAKYPEACSHCLYAVSYVATHTQGVVSRDACRFLIYYILGVREPKQIRKIYREAILGPTAVGSDGFDNLDRYVREEMAKLNPDLIRLVTEQPPLNHQELEWARNITMARFTLGVDRDPVPYQDAPKRNKFIRLLSRFFG